MGCSSTKEFRLNSPKTVQRIEAGTDPVVDHARAWIAAKDAQDVLIMNWQDAEHRLSIRIKPMKIGFAQAVRGDLREARSMRYLMRRIKAADRELDRSAAQIALMQPTTSLGALAKIEMALRIQQPTNLEERSWALLDSGAKELRKLLIGG